MPTWNEIDQEIEALQATRSDDAQDVVRHKYLSALASRVGRPVIAYYSGFLTRRDQAGRIHPECAVSDLDMNGLMAVVHCLDRSKGLDLVLHTPGGGIEAGRAFVEYLHKMFGYDLRVIVPHMAMSVGTMIACASRQVIMGKHSCLGPTDPQINGLPAMGVLAEVDQAIAEIKVEPLKQLVWQAVFSKYPPAFILDCERSVKGARTMVKGWLQANMLSKDASAEDSAEHVVAALMNYSGTSGHGEHYLIDKCRAIGLNVAALEDDQDLQEAVLSVHHSYMATFTRSQVVKLIENSEGKTWVVAS